MRTAFVKTITRLAEKDKNVWLLTGDLGFSVFEDFAKKFPKQYLNVGVAEQNLIGVAAGLALSGKKVFAYSISTFASMRPYEQIRNDVCYQNLPVFIIGGGSIFSYSTFGCTHSSLEDLGIMRLLPNMVVMCPGDPLEVEKLIMQIYKRGGPTYLRLAKKGEPIIHKKTEKIILGKISVLKEGKDFSLITSGPLSLSNALSVDHLLEKEKISCRILNCHTLKPIDKGAIIKTAKKTKAIITIEEHNYLGGLGTVVSEVLVEAGIKVPFKKIGVPDVFPPGVGSQDYFLKKYGMDAKGIIRAIKTLMK